MAELVAVIASTHQLWLDNMPQFLVGKAPTYDANWYNEEREFGLPRMVLPGDEDFSEHILRGGLDAVFDLAFSNELRIDHSITCPIITLRPQADLPIVPIYTNIFAPPLPRPKRFVQLGRTIRELVESWPSDERVAVIGTGHLSLELGGPRQFGPHGPDPEFDRKAVEWISSGDIEGCLAEVTLDSLHVPGNATHGFMDFMLMMGIAGEGIKADYIDAERTTWLVLDESEREALATHDYPTLFDMGAHPFLTLTLFIAMFERDHAEPLGFQLEYARRLADRPMPYPNIAT